MGEGIGCQCSKSGLARTLPRQRPYAGGGWGRISMSLFQMWRDARVFVGDEMPSLESGPMSSAATWTWIGVGGM